MTDPLDLVGKMVLYQFHKDQGMILIAADVIAYHEDACALEMNVYKPDGSIEHRFNDVKETTIVGIIGNAKHKEAVVRKVHHGLRTIDPWGYFDGRD